MGKKNLYFYVFLKNPASLNQHAVSRNLAWISSDKKPYYSNPYYWRNSCIPNYTNAIALRCTSAMAPLFCSTLLARRAFLQIISKNAPEFPEYWSAAMIDFDPDREREKTRKSPTLFVINQHILDALCIKKGW